MSSSAGSGFGFTFERVRWSKDKTGLLGDCRARLGRLTCPHGTIETPNFIFCATKGVVKGLSLEQLKRAQTDIILSNTYHLAVNPGADTVEAQGGLHRFTRWDGPMLTDSGGYQVFAMGHGSVSEEVKGKRKIWARTQSASNGTPAAASNLLKIDENGVRFRSYLDGSTLFFSPETSISIQRKLGADFIVQFDECTPYHVDRNYTAESMRRSLRWGDRSLAEFARGADGSQAMYGVVQGGVYPDLRAESAEGVSRQAFFGTAVGGSLGQDRRQMWRVVRDTAVLLPEDRPVHLLGIGHLADIFYGVLQGMDTFDCVHPTRLARHGYAILPFAAHRLKPGAQGALINIRNRRFRTDSSPLAEESPLSELEYSKAYIQYLFRVSDMLGPQLLSLNNVYQMNQLMRDIRAALREDRFEEVVFHWLGLTLEQLLEYGA